MKRRASMPLVKVRFQGITSGVQKRGKPAGAQFAKKLRRLCTPGAGAFGAPSTWLFLIRLHACRAGLCFTRLYKASLPFVAVNHVSQRWPDVRAGKPSLFKESHHE